MNVRAPLRRSFPAAFELYLGSARVVVTSQLPHVARGLWAVWRSAGDPIVPVSQTHELSVRLGAEPEGVEVWLDGSLVDRTSVADALPVTERMLYQHIGPWLEPDLAVLHGGLLAGSDACALLIGRSGAGKSSLTWTGIQYGYVYGGDEVVLCDGERVWGVPRAVLFDPTVVGNDLPEVAASADRQRYCFTNWYGEPCFLPICSPPERQVLRAPRTLESTHFFLLEHGEPLFEPATCLQVLATLHRECRGDVGQLVPGLDPARCHRLRWNDLDWAMEQLAPLLGPAVSPQPIPGGVG